MSLDTDNEGFLKDYTTWSESIAPVLAAAEGIELTAAHWEIIHAVRNYYAQYHISAFISCSCLHQSPLKSLPRFLAYRNHPTVIND